MLSYLSNSSVISYNPDMNKTENFHAERYLGREASGFKMQINTTEVKLAISPNIREFCMYLL